MICIVLVLLYHEIQKNGISKFSIKQKGKEKIQPHTYICMCVCMYIAICCIYILHRGTYVDA